MTAPKQGLTLAVWEYLREYVVAPGLKSRTAGLRSYHPVEPEKPAVGTGWKGTDVRLTDRLAQVLDLLDEDRSEARKRLAKHISLTGWTIQ